MARRILTKRESEIRLAHPAGGSHHAFQAVFQTKVDFVKVALSRPTHQYVMQTIAIVPSLRSGIVTP